MSTPAAPSVEYFQFAFPTTNATHTNWPLVGTESVDYTVPNANMDTGYACIFKMQNTGDMSASAEFALQYSLDGSTGWTAVTTTSSYVRVDTGSGDTDDRTIATERLTAVSSPYTATLLDKADGLIGANLGSDDSWEFYFAILFRSADFNGGDDVFLRIISDDTVTMNATPRAIMEDVGKTADGSPSITPVEASGTGVHTHPADGSPSITPVESAGVSEVIRTADGSPSTTPIESAGSAAHVHAADGSPSVTPAEAAGLSETIRTADGSPSITPVESSGTGVHTLSADGSPSITPVEAAGVGVGPAGGPDQTADGSPSITPITAEGVSEILREAIGSPSITPITAEGVSEIIRDASGSPSITPITASGSSFIWPKVYLNTTESLSGATEMTISSVDVDGTSITFDDSVGAPVGALFLGVENRVNGDVGWIAVTVTESVGPTVIFGGLGA